MMNNTPSKIITSGLDISDMTSKIDNALIAQEKHGPNRSHVTLLQQILNEMRRTKQGASTWNAAVDVIHVRIGAMSYETRRSYVVKPWLLAMMNESALLSAEIESAADADDAMTTKQDNDTTQVMPA